MRGFGACAVALALALFAGCGPDSSEGGAAASKSSPASPGSAGSPSPVGVDAGEFVVSVVGGRVQLASREASRLAILRRLADLEGFTLDTGDLPPRQLSAQLEDAPMAEALAVLLDDQSYRTAWEHDAALGRNRLASLTVGRASGAASAPDPGGSASSLASGNALPPPPIDLSELDDEERRLLRDLDRANDRDRLAAVEEIDVYGPALARVAEVALRDPSPLVRAAAVEQLGDSDTHLAVSALMEALRDPDPEVVLKAIEAFEFAGDESIVHALDPLLDHPDPRVREAASEARELLE